MLRNRCIRSPTSTYAKLAEQVTRRRITREQERVRERGTLSVCNWRLYAVTGSRRVNPEEVAPDPQRVIERCLTSGR